MSLEGGIMSFLVTGCLDRYTTAQVSDVASSSCVVCRVVEDAAAKHAALLTNFCDCAHNKLSKYALGFFLCELLTIVITICHVGLTSNIAVDRCKDTIIADSGYPRLPQLSIPGLWSPCLPLLQVSTEK